MSTGSATGGIGPAPAAVPDLGTGPAPSPGRPDRLGPGLLRVTAPNPGVMTGPGTNTYLVGTAEVVVVDPGPDDPEHRRAVQAAAASQGSTIRWVTVTHSHRDHAPGAGALAEAAGAELIGYRPAEGFEPTRTVSEGWCLLGPDFTLRAVHTPGHASDHLCWYFEEAQVLLSGDHVMEGSTVVIRPPDGDMVQYLSSLERLLFLDPPVLAIAPGHGRLISDPARAVRSIVGHRLDRERRVAAALAVAGTATVDELLPVVYEDVTGEIRLDMARYSLWAHLAKLAADGRAVARDEAGHDGGDGLAVRWAATAAT